ncbi:MAG: hypothetical protein HC874_32030 [Richelia sp. SL_2_1]|nr:hypothetical protein [Richelia sp. SM1_7_0]NJN12669.1 hypothetical protein [Richelia sp. RM1_1_1]NJO31665.1 hypothetical protein [Richelia sp. SL_2_1]
MKAEQTVIFVSAAEITNHILEDLQKLSTYSGEPMAAVYADNLLREMHLLRDKYMDNPIAEVVIALHDALFFQNRWIDYTAYQYLQAYNLLSSLARQETINNSSVEEAILVLEKDGFNTLPFGVQLDFNRVDGM